MRIPEFLKATYTMLMEAFPNGICEENYFVILYLFYDYMSDENLTLLMSFFTDKSLGIIENDIYRVHQMKFDSQLLDAIKSRLDKYGFEEWKKTE